MTQMNANGADEYELSVSSVTSVEKDPRGMGLPIRPCRS